MPDVATFPYPCRYGSLSAWGCADGLTRVRRRAAGSGSPRPLPFPIRSKRSNSLEADMLGPSFALSAKRHHAPIASGGGQVDGSALTPRTRYGVCGEARVDIGFPWMAIDWRSFAAKRDGQAKHRQASVLKRCWQRLGLQHLGWAFRAGARLAIAIMEACRQERNASIAFSAREYVGELKQRMPGSCHGFEKLLIRERNG